MPAKKKTTGKSPPPRRRSPRREAPKREAPRRERFDASQEPPPVSPFVPGMSAQCLVCPICMGLYALQQSRPEAMEHLMAAGHELFLAFRALVESHADRWDQVNTLQRISVR